MRTAESSLRGRVAVYNGGVRSPLAVLFALCAALLYGAGNALEHRVVNETDRDPRLHVGLLAKLARSPWWLLGMFGDVAAFGFQAAALAYGNLLFVQPLLVCGLLVGLPLSAHWTHQPLRTREYATAVVLCVALATFLILANPGGGQTSAAYTSWLRTGGAVAVLVTAAVLTATRTRGHVRAALLGFAAGGLFGITAALTRTFVIHIQHGVPYTASHWEVYALAILSITGILFTQHGFQNAALSASLPALEATEPVIAATLGVVLFHEQLNGQTALDNLLIGAAILTILCCVIVLASSAGRRAPQPEPRAAPV
jgi:drug/metabolite transporter (DMT)-like permease